jgi:hypothetical protein
MSLAWHFRNKLDSPIGEFLQKRLSHTKRLTIHANGQLQRKRTFLPSSPYCPFSTLERAIRYRICYSFALTPSKELLAWCGAFERLVCFDDEVYVGGPYTSNVLKLYFEHLDETLNIQQPIGRSLDAKSEHLLARYCFVLALLEEVIRRNSYRYSPLVMPRPKKSVDELLAIPQEEWIDDLCNLFRMFYKHYASILSRPSILSPSFAGETGLVWAGADLLVDGCVMQIKASVEPKIQSMWLRNLAGCVLLDFEDQHHIHSVGIYMVRQGLLVSWSLDAFFGRLTGESHTNLASLRQEFRKCCENIPDYLYW